MSEISIPSDSQSLPADFPSGIPSWQARETTSRANRAKVIAHAAECLAQGELVAMPTETVYGLAGKAFNPLALAKIFAVKRRPFFDPLIVHVHSLDQVEECCDGILPAARRLMESFWPGPLTVVLPRSIRIPDLATSGLPTVALRMPNHPIALELLRACEFPLAAPSANPFGALSPTRAEHVAGAFSEGIAGILDGGACRIGVESTIVGWDKGEPVLLRAGGLEKEAIEACLGVTLRLPMETGEGKAVNAPGRLPWHYSPSTPLRIVAGSTPREERGMRGYLAFCSPGASDCEGYATVETLSAEGDLHEAASRLFSCLHRLDALHLKGIDAEALPEAGLGLAIMDRLRKASARPGLPLGHAET